MSPRNRQDVARHFARPHHSSPDGTAVPGDRGTSYRYLADEFDVHAAFAPDYDFGRAFADLDGFDEAPFVPVRPHRSRVAFASAVTAVALPLLVVDSLGAGAESNDRSISQEQVASAAEQASSDIDTLRASVPLADPTATTIYVTTTVPVITTAIPTTTTTEAPVTTTTKPPAPVTTKAPVTTTTKPPAPATTTTVKAPIGAATATGKGDPTDPATWDAMAECESGGNWAANTGNGYYGGLQFSQASWENVGGTGLPSDAPKSTQIEMGKRLQARQGWAAWPTCARKLGFIN